MSDYGDFCREMRNGRRDLRRALGVDCPHCNDLQPNRIPTILLPSQTCRVCGYKDPRKHTKSGPGGSVGGGAVKPPENSSTYITCPTCQRSVVVSRKGRIAKHQVAGGNLCDASGDLVGAPNNQQVKGGSS